MIRAFVLPILFCLAALPALAQTGAATAGAAPAIASPAAAQRASAGELVLVDVRHVQEWRQTGLARGAVPISIHDPAGLPAFLEKIARLTGGDLTQPVAFVCATGVRSGFAADLLRRQGYREVYNLAEGMMGSSAGPGWLRRDLPTRPCDC
jgi:rhodanese-related sulfurtransferase